MIKYSFGVNFEAYFLGPKGENYDFYEKLLKNVLHDHMRWRKAFHSEESTNFITESDKNRNDFRIAQNRIEGTLVKLCEVYLSMKKEIL